MAFYLTAIQVMIIGLSQHLRGENIRGAGTHGGSKPHSAETLSVGLEGKNSTAKETLNWTVC